MAKKNAPKKNAPEKAVTVSTKVEPLENRLSLLVEKIQNGEKINFNGSRLLEAALTMLGV